MTDLMIPTQEDNLTINIINKIIKEEYGGCDPSKDNPCILKAVVSDGKEGYGAPLVYVWVVGKWRPIGKTGYKGLPSGKMVTEAIKRIRINTGSKLDASNNLVDGTFDEKEIMLKFIKFGVSANILKS